MNRNKTKLFLVLSGIVLLILYLCFLFLQGKGGNIPLFMIINFISFAVFFAIVFGIEYEKIVLDKSHLPVIFVFAVLFRLTLIPSQPSVSPDVYRYLWEGKVVLNGFNPFEYSPDSEQLKNLYSENLSSKVTYPDMTSIYPTSAQAVFAAGYFIGGEKTYGIKIIYLFFDAIGMIFLILLLRMEKIDENYFIYYAWMPLPIMEFYINAHIDIVGISLLIIFLYFFRAGKYSASIPFYALSITTKLFPLLFFPLLIKQMGWKRTIRFGAALLILLVILILPIIPRHINTEQSLFIYLSRWYFNGSVFHILKSIFHSPLFARAISYSLFAIGVIIVSIKYKSFWKGLSFFWIMFFIFAPTVYPWYLSWSAALNPFAFILPLNWLYFSSNLSNFSALSPHWREFTFVYLIEYIPFLPLFLNGPAIEKMKSLFGFFKFGRARKN